VNQINVNPPGVERVESVDSSGDRTAAAGINMITVLIVLAVLAIVAWYLFTGPLRSLGAATNGGTTNVNVNPAPTVNINPPNPGQPGGSNTGGSTTGSGGSTGGSSDNSAPSKP